jgi:hypothetical protein
MSHKIRITIASLVTALFLAAMSAAGALSHTATGPTATVPIHVGQPAPVQVTHFEPVEPND